MSSRVLPVLHALGDLEEALDQDGLHEVGRSSRCQSQVEVVEVLVVGFANPAEPNFLQQALPTLGGADRDVLGDVLLLLVGAR